MTYSYEYPRALVTVDAIIFSNDAKPKLLLIQRANEPFANMWALPGGFIEMDESLDDSVNREVYEETSLVNLDFVQFKAYGNPNRDPRGRNIAVVFYAKCLDKKIAKAGDDAKNLSWFDFDKLPKLAFDHETIIQDFVKAGII